MIREGNSHPGNSLTGDDKPVPKFCPVCGRSNLVPFWWQTVDKTQEYPSLVCYGRDELWLRVGLFRFRLRGLPRPTGWTQPGNGAHYQYELPVRDISPGETVVYDRETGKRLTQ